VFGTAAAPPSHAPKSVLGEPMGVGGALCLALSLWAGDTRPAAPAVVNSSSLGGSHVSLVVAPGDPHRTGDPGDPDNDEGVSQ
jgi:3-oxoacyl-[acyl-carrier-protein] synthase II